MKTQIEQGDWVEGEDGEILFQGRSTLDALAFPYTQFFFHRDQDEATSKMEEIIQQLIEVEHEQRNKKKDDWREGW